MPGMVESDPFGSHSGLSFSKGLFCGKSVTSAALLPKLTERADADFKSPSTQPMHFFRDGEDSKKIVAHGNGKSWFGKFAEPHKLGIDSIIAESVVDHGNPLESMPCGYARFFGVQGKKNDPEFHPHGFLGKLISFGLGFGGGFSWVPAGEGKDQKSRFCEIVSGVDHDRMESPLLPFGGCCGPSGI